MNSRFHWLRDGQFLPELGAQDRADLVPIAEAAGAGSRRLERDDPIIDLFGIGCFAFGEWRNKGQR